MRLGPDPEPFLLVTVRDPAASLPWPSLQGASLLAAQASCSQDPDRHSRVTAENSCCVWKWFLVKVKGSPRVPGTRQRLLSPTAGTTGFLRALPVFFKLWSQADPPESRGWETARSWLGGQPPFVALFKMVSAWSLGNLLMTSSGRPS